MKITIICICAFEFLFDKKDGVVVIFHFPRQWYINVTTHYESPKWISY